MNYLLSVHNNRNYTYKRIANGINSILIKNNSILRLSYRMVQRYATGECLPKQDDIIKAIAQYVNVSERELINNFKESKLIRGINK